MTTALRLSLIAILLLAVPASGWAQSLDVKWGTSAAGSAGHRSMVNLASVLGRELPELRISVLPTPGAIVTVKGYATGQFDGYYGSDVAFYELANDISRFKGFKAQAKRMPVQSLWIFTTEVGAAIHARDRDRFKAWRDLSGQRVFTGPLPWDVRAVLERAFQVLGVKHEYMEVDLQSVGSLLERGTIKGFIVYTNALASTAPWITETSLSTDWAMLNPSAEEREALTKAGMPVIEVPAAAYKRDVHAKTVHHIPFYYGFHLGREIPEEVVYKVIKAVEKNVAELAKIDPAYAQVRDDMVGMQRKGIESSIDLVEIHRGLARWMREKGAWSATWDARIAK
jgi:TRAP-type uncharacterized transport system substrate-binding protein